MIGGHRQEEYIMGGLRVSRAVSLWNKRAGVAIERVLHSLRPVELVLATATGSVFSLQSNK